MTNTMSSDIFKKKYKKLKYRLKVGGWAYLIRNMLGYPVRIITNHLDENRQRKLLFEVANRDLSNDIRLSGREMPNVVVSLTSYPERLFALPLCLKSLLLQDILPDRIIVYFGSDTKQTQIEGALKEYEQYGIEFRFDEKCDLKPHKKYYYAMREFPSARVITVDDDLVYPSDMVRSLLDSSQRWPNAVCSRRVHRIETSKYGIKPYEVWKKNYKKVLSPSDILFATGGSGTLYPPNSLARYAFDHRSIINDCLMADDIWLKCMELIVGTKVVYVPNSCAFAVIDNTQKMALKNSNIGEDGHNDKYFRHLITKYNIPIDVLYFGGKGI